MSERVFPASEAMFVYFRNYLRLTVGEKLRGMLVPVHTRCLKLVMVKSDQGC